MEERWKELETVLGVCERRLLPFSGVASSEQTTNVQFEYTHVYQSDFIVCFKKAKKQKPK
jgi:hypothetical protein